MSFFQFSNDYLQFLMKKEDVWRYRLGESSEEVRHNIESTVTQLNSEEFTVELHDPVIVRNNILYEPKRFKDKIFIRHLNYRLCKKYNVRHSNRRSIVRQIKVLLHSDSHLKIVRADIKQFFQNIKFGNLVERLRSDGFLRSRDIEAIEKIKNFTLRFQSDGIPWGLSLSSTLAEVYLREIDAEMRQISGVYYYQRFVDDIVIFTSSEADTLKVTLDNKLKNLHLELNMDKSISMDENPTNNAKFSFLGYEFMRPIVKNIGQKITKIDVRIAESKIDRIKRRLGKSFSQFYSDQNWKDLRDRIKLLTGNCVLNKSSHQESIKSGVFFNYSEITEDSQLREMDLYLLRKILALRSFLKRRNHDDHQPKIKKLLRMSFVTGFNKRVMHRFVPERLANLTLAWHE